MATVLETPVVAAAMEYDPRWACFLFWSLSLTFGQFHRLCISFNMTSVILETNTLFSIHES